MGRRIASLGWRGLKISGSGRPQQDIADYDQQHDMRYRFRQRVKCAHDNVKGEPSEYQPASPVVTREQEDSADDSDYPNDGDKDDPAIKRTFRKVIDEANQTHNDEQTA